MIDATHLTEELLRILAHEGLRPDPDKIFLNRLRAVFDAASGLIDADQFHKDLVALEKAQTHPDRTQAVEALLARAARAVVEMTLAEGMGGKTSKDAQKWLRANVTAISTHMPKAKAILRVRMSATGGDEVKVAAQLMRDVQAAIPSGDGPRPIITQIPALASDLIAPVVTGGGGLQPPMDGGGDDGVSDPTLLRDQLLAIAQINPAGLSAAMRNIDNQNTYIDAIIQGLELMGHGPGSQDDLIWAGAASGLMLSRGNLNPRDPKFFTQVQRVVTELSSSADENGQINIDGTAHLMFAPSPQTTQRFSLFKKSWNLLTQQKRSIFLQSFAASGIALVKRFPDHRTSDELGNQIAEAAYEKDLDHGVSSLDGSGGGEGVVDVSLPPLNDPHGYNDEIERENIKAVSTIYVSYQLEFAFKACSRLLDLFVAGLLPINATDAGSRDLDKLYWDQEDLLDEATRRSIQARVIGAPGGEIGFGMQPNTEFQTLLMRCVSAVSEFEREQNIVAQFDRASAGQRVQSTSGEFVRKAVRDFAANASLRGWAGTAFAAERMARHIKRVMHVLGLPAVRNAFGVTTPWQVVERVSQREFGETVNTVLHRTLAVETQTIMQIIGDNHTIWSNSSGSDLFSTETRAGDLDLETTRRLMRACQHFRAVTGVGDSLMHEYSEPVETIAQPSLPDIGIVDGIGGGGGMGMPQFNMGGIEELRQMAASGQTPSPDQIMRLTQQG